MVNIGVEIEVSSYNPGTRDPYGDETCGEIQGRGWRIVNDGSLNGERTGEFVSPPFSSFAALQADLRLLRQYNLRTNDSCGLHVHLDAGGWTWRQLRGLWSRQRQFGDLILYSMLPPCRLRHYSQPIHTNRGRPALVSRPEHIWEQWYAGHWARGSNAQWSGKYHNTRYAGLNLHSYFFRGTAEFRHAPGLCKTTEIIDWCKFLDAYVTRAISEDSAGDWRDVCPVKTPANPQQNAYDRFMLWLDPSPRQAAYIEKGIKAHAPNIETQGVGARTIVEGAQKTAPQEDGFPMPASPIPTDHLRYNAVNNIPIVAEPEAGNWWFGLGWNELDALVHRLGRGIERGAERTRHLPPGHVNATRQHLIHGTRPLI